MIERNQVIEAISKQMDIEKKRQPLSEIEKLLENYSGGVWIIGGFVVKAAIDKLYGSYAGATDLDIMLNESYDPNLLPTLEGWKRDKTSFGNLRLIKDQMQIDVWSLKNSNRLKTRKLEFTVENYLKTVPFTIQSIAYEYYSGIVVGDIGIEAIRTKTIAVNDISEADYYPKRKNIPIDDIIKNKAERLGFRILPKGSVKLK